MVVVVVKLQCFIGGGGGGFPHQNFKFPPGSSIAKLNI